MSFSWTFPERTYANIKIIGGSVAGVSTCFTLPELKVAFDVAQGLPFALNMRNYLITHGHMDHAAGIPYIISQKALTGQPTANFYMPPVMIEPITQIIQTWAHLENHEYKYNFIPTAPDVFVDLSPEYAFKIFPTVHRVPSNGYCIFRKTKKLKAALMGKSEAEIIKARQHGAQVHELYFDPLIAFTGDTQIEFLDQCDWIKKVRVLMMEVTYIDSSKTVAQAREWGHIHLDEVLPRLSELECEKIIFTHLSSRHRLNGAEKYLREQLPARERNRVEFFVG